MTSVTTRSHAKASAKPSATTEHIFHCKNMAWYNSVYITIFWSSLGLKTFSTQESLQSNGIFTALEHAFKPEQLEKGLGRTLKALLVVPCVELTSYVNTDLNAVHGTVLMGLKLAPSTFTWYVTSCGSRCFAFINLPKTKHEIFHTSHINSPM